MFNQSQPQQQLQDPQHPQQQQLLSASLAGFPPAFGADGLAQLLDKSITAILADRSRAPHRLPPACLPPGTQKPVWLLADVIAWLASHREGQPQTSPPPPTAAATPPKRGRGRSHKVPAAQEGGAE